MTAQLIKEGAESRIYRSTWHDKEVIIKSRIPKSYRHEIIDRQLRNERLKNEANLIREARDSGVATPIIYDIDIEKNQLIMEYIPGKTVKYILDNDTIEMQNQMLELIGLNVAKLHKNNIIHGDLTTSNMLFFKERLYFIDFSLGERSKELEPRGVDLRLLKEAINSAHSTIKNGFEKICIAYKKEYKLADEVLKKLREIELRGRYT